MFDKRELIDLMEAVTAKVIRYQQVLEQPIPYGSSYIKEDYERQLSKFLHLQKKLQEQLKS